MLKNDLTFEKTTIISSYMGLGMRKPVFRVSEKARLKPVYSAIETSYNSEISLEIS